jgi:uncharacterized protein YPO0396
MHLRQLTLINWGTYEPRTFEFLGTTLITGSNGSGKSMLFDAIQTVLTAAYVNVVRYNVAQAEDSTRDRNKVYRSLPGYALGQISNHIQREAAQTWIVAVFAPETHEIANPFTALVGVSARREGGVAMLEQIALYLIRAEVEKKHLITANDRALPLKEAKDHFLGLFGKQNVNPYGELKTHYLCDLYGWFEGKGSVPETQAMGSAKALARAISAKPIRSVHELVRDEMLDERDLASLTHDIANSLRELHRLNTDAKQLKASVDELKGIYAQLMSLRGHLSEARAREIAMTAAQITYHERRERKHAEALGQQTSLAQELARQIEQENKTLEELRDEQVRIEAALLSTEAGGREKLLAEKLKNTREALSREGIELLEGLNAVKKWREGYLAHAGVLIQNTALRPIGEPVDELLRNSYVEQFESVAACVRTALQSNQDMGLNREAIERIQERLDEAHTLASKPEGLIEQVSGAWHADQTRAKVLKEEIEALTRRIASLRGGEIPLPDEVRDLLTAIRRELPGAEPTLLADHIQPKANTLWQGAIEGYMGRDRYAVIVKPEFEARAYRLLLQLHGTRRGVAKVIQVSRLRADKGTHQVPIGSLIEELVIEHPVAQLFMTANYGNALKVETTGEATIEEIIKQTRRGITLDGRQVGGYSASRYQMLEEGECIFGRAARARNLARTEAELISAREEAHHIRQRTESFQALLRLWPTERITLVDRVIAIAELQQRQATQQAEYDAIDRSSNQLLEEKKKIVVAAIASSNAALQTALEEKGKAEEAARNAREQQTESQRDLERSRISHEEALRRAEAVTCMDETVTVESLREQAERYTQEVEADLQKISGTEGQLRQAIGDEWPSIGRQIAEYNLQSLGTHRIQAELRVNSHSVDELMRLSEQVQGAVAQVRELLRDLEDNAMARMNDSLDQNLASFNSTFTTNFAMSLHNAIDDGVRPLRELNASLRTRVFGHDTYRVSYEWVPEFKDYADFFQELTRRSHEIDTASGKTLFDLPMDTHLARIRDRLKDLLLGQDLAAAEQELGRLTDWRSYRTYDIMVTNTTLPDSEVSYSRHGMFSGGENKTPIYVVRAAALATALRHTNSSKTHLYMLFLDEAFHAMDTERSRQTLDLQHKQLGFQVLVALPTQDAGKVRELFDRELQFAMIDGLPKGSGTRITHLVAQVELKKEQIARTRERTRERIEREERELMDRTLREAQMAAGG